MNEGWATFWHYTLLNRLYDDGYVNDGFMMEVLQSHTNVVFQPDFDSPYYSGINPYALGFAMMRDMRRICEEPTDEDRYWFPDIAGRTGSRCWTSRCATSRTRASSPSTCRRKLMRDFHLFQVRDDDREDTLEITAIHEEAGYRQLRQALAEQYNLGNREPNIQVYNVDLRGDRSMTLRHYRHNRRPLGDSLDEMLLHIRRLWGFDVRLESVDEDGRVQLIGEA
jgi:stage V sporulation protein R